MTFASIFHSDRDPDSDAHRNQKFRANAPLCADCETHVTLWASQPVLDFNAEGVASQSPGLAALFAANPGLCSAAPLGQFVACLHPYKCV
jgi:hypothetical protein